MGRRRTKSPSWLPRRCYQHRRQILYRPTHGKAVPLGPVDDPAACMRRYGELVGAPRRLSTMGDVIDRFLLEVVPKKAARTQEDYAAYCVKLKHAFEHMAPDEITITDLYEYHAAREAPVRANREIAVLGSIYRHAIRWSAATRNPVRGQFIFADEDPRDRYVTGSERRRFARICPTWLHGYLTLKHLTGRRQGELLRLGLFSERHDGLAFRILKKRRFRELVIEWTPRLRRVWEWLKKNVRRPPSSTVIFPASRGKRRGQAMSSQGFKSAWARAMKEWSSAGNEAFWEHDLRASSASAADSDERARELLDHEDLRTTRRSYRRGVQKVRPLR